jgi:hypothetical protein
MNLIHPLGKGKSLPVTKTLIGTIKLWVFYLLKIKHIQVIQALVQGLEHEGELPFKTR